MNTKKLILTILVSIFFILILTSCARFNPPDENQIMSDLPEEVKRIFVETPFERSDPYVYFLDVKSVTITNRHTESDRDIILCSVDLENEWYHFTKNLKLTYHLTSGKWELYKHEYTSDSAYHLIGNPLLEKAKEAKEYLIDGVTVSFIEGSDSWNEIRASFSCTYTKKELLATSEHEAKFTYTTFPIGTDEIYWGDADIEDSITNISWHADNTAWYFHGGSTSSWTFLIDSIDLPNNKVTLYYKRSAFGASMSNMTKAVLPISSVSNGFINLDTSAVSDLSTIDFTSLRIGADALYCYGRHALQYDTSWHAMSRVNNQ